MFLKLLLTITCVQVGINQNIAFVHIFQDLRFFYQFYQLCYGAVILGNLHDGLENENQQNLYNRYTKFLNYIQHEKEPSFGVSNEIV